MAFGSVGTLGSALSSGNNQASLTLTTSAAVEAGNLLVVIIAVDNNDTTDGASTAVSGITAGGLPMTKAIEYTNTVGGAAQDGASVGIWYQVRESQLNTSSSVVASFTSGTTADASAMSAWEFTIGAGKTVAVEATNTLSNDAANAGSLNAVTANIECLRIRAIASESSSTTALTKTAAFTAILTQAVSGAGTSATEIGIRGEYLISTSTGQASAPTGGAGAVDHASAYVAFKEIDKPVSGWQTVTRDVKAAARVWPMLLLATQATQFSAPAPVVESDVTSAIGWQIQSPKAPAVAKAVPTQATSFAVPPPADNNTTSKAWHQPLSKPVPVAKAQQGSTFVPFNTAQVVSDTPRGWQRDLSTAPRRAVIANTPALTFVAAPFTVPKGWEGQPSVAPKLARVSASVLVGPLYPAAINNNTDAKGWFPPLAGAPKPAQANPTQATSFQTPEQSAVVDNNTDAKGWFPPLAGAPKTAQPQHTQATSFQTPEQEEVVDNNTLSKAWHQDLSRPVPVAKARQGHSFVPFNTTQIVVSPQTVPLYQDSSATYTFPVYFQALVYPPQYIAPPADNNTTSKGWQQPLSGAPKTAKAKQSQATSFQTPEQSGVTPTPTPEQFGWVAPLSKSAPVAKAKQGNFFVPFDTVQIVISPQTVPLIQDASAVYDRPVYYQATIAPPAYIAPSNNVTSLSWQQSLSGAPKTARAVHTSPAFVARPFPQFSLAWQQPLSRAVPVATAQQGWTFVPLNTAQTPPAGIEGMAWHLPLGIVAARLLAAPQGWTFVPFDTVQVEPPPPEFDIPPVPDSGGTGLKTGTDRLRGGTKRDPAAYAPLRKAVREEIKPDLGAIEQARLEAEAQAKLAKEQLAAAAPLSSLVEKTTAEQPTIEPTTDDEEAIAILLLS